MKNNKFCELARLLRGDDAGNEAKCALLILTHTKPDGDALGSAFGFARLARSAGLDAKLLLPERLPEKYQAMAAQEEYCTSLAGAGNFDRIVVLDCARAGRAAGVEPSFLTPENTVNIDHHADNDMRDFPGLTDGTAAATAELLAELALEGEFGTLDARTADWLFLGLATDTGGFRFSNTDARAFRTAAALAEAGADVDKVNNAAFFSKPERQQRFEAEMIVNFSRSAFDGKLLYAAVPPELFEKYGFSMRDGESVIELLREISGVVIAALLYRTGRDVKISLRSKDRDVPVGPLARELGGGGHAMAAGITLKDVSLESAEQTLLEKIGALLKS